MGLLLCFPFSIQEEVAQYQAGGAEQQAEPSPAQEPVGLCCSSTGLRVLLRGAGAQ